MEDEDETITIQLAEYNELKRSQAVLEWLEARGVDNWSGYCTPPDPDDYGSYEEYEEAYEEALYE